MKIPVLKESFAPVSNMIGHGLSAQVLHGAVELKIFDHLEKERPTPEELAIELGAAPGPLEALLESLAAMGLVVKNGERYANAPVASEYLVTWAEAFQGPYIEFTVNYHQGILRDLPGLMKGSTPPREFGSTALSSADNIKTMGSISFQGHLQNGVAFIRALPGFMEFRKMCDVAGNHGYYSMGLMDENPNLESVVCDLPDVIDQAGHLHREMGYGRRISTLGIDLDSEASLGSGYDLALASHVLYNWRHDLGPILEKIARSLKTGGYFVSNHFHMPEDEDLSSRIVELSVRLAGYPGHHLSETELKTALEANGFGQFTLSRSTNTKCLFLAAQKLK
ncbi:MAG: hypothetical protein GY737_24330 [Desulfobacteraceae bacterium]|nr:hypothetical protein [Desulfobacteraceae bacterium]